MFNQLYQFHRRGVNLCDGPERKSSVDSPCFGGHNRVMSTGPLNTPPSSNLTKIDPASPLSADCEMVVDMVREMSLQTDPQEMVSVFRHRAVKLYGGAGSMSLSRRGLEYPQYRMTRNTLWKENINPWEQPERLPLLSGGLLAELIYGDRPMILNDTSVHHDDPAYEYLKDLRAFVALPLFDMGVALNMVVRFAKDVNTFANLNLADALLTANMFGRATSSLIMAQRLEAAYAQLDREMVRVAEIQKSLLPARLPKVPGLDIAVSYKPADRAGGDYYDFFDLEDGRWGFLIADVSGHGTPAAVVMAMLRSMLHARCIECVTPGELLAEVNKQLCDQSSCYDGTFVTAFFGVFDPAAKSLHYSCAGHNPPLLVDHQANVRELADAQSPPLGIERGVTFLESTTQLASGDTLLLYTDGITEATNESGEQYGPKRLLSCVSEDVPNAQHIIDCVTHKLMAFAASGPQTDDQTLVALRLDA